MPRPKVVAPILASVVLAAAVFAVTGLPGIGVPGLSDVPSGSGSPLGSASPPAATSGPSAVLPTPTPSPSPSPTPGPTQPPAPEPIPAAELQAVLDRAIAKAAIPGASVTIAWPDGRSWTGTVGLADVTAERPVTPDTAFAIASMSKTFTAALILRLVEDGHLSLGDRVAALLPDVKVGRTITVRMLLDHTSGLADFFFGPGIDRALLADRGRTWTAARALRYVGPRRYLPGKGWNYSNTNYLLLGLIAERVGGAPFAVQVRERFLDPLGLTGAYVQAVEAPRGPLTRGYRFDGPGKAFPPIDVSDETDVRPFTSVVTAAGAAGNIAATSRDLARWAQALYGGTVLRPETLQAAVDDALLTARHNRVAGYGLGVQVTRIGSHRAWGHSGRLLGFRGELRYLPDEGVAIAILTNQSRADVHRIVVALLRIAAPPRLPCPNCV